MVTTATTRLISSIKRRTLLPGEQRVTQYVPVALQRPVVCFVTDRSRFGGAEAAEKLVDLITDASYAGVDVIQIREGDLPDRTLADLVTRAVDVTRETGTRIVVNDRMDVALSAGAAGVHLKSDSIPACLIRPMVPPDWLLGRSVHGMDEAVEASEAGGLDYLTFGTVFETASKPRVKATGLTRLEQVALAVTVPVLAIGGLTVSRAGDLGRHRAAGIAASSVFIEVWQHGGRKGLTELVGGLRRSFDSGRELL